MKAAGALALERANPFHPAKKWLARGILAAGAGAYGMNRLANKPEPVRPASSPSVQGGYS